MFKSVVVKQLADMASQGKYNVDPQGAANMTALYQAVAKVINELEAEEAAALVNEENKGEENGS